jgi:flagellar protein FliS
MNYPTNALAKYGSVSVATSSPAQVTVMLYDALFRFLREAMVAMQAGDRPRTGERIHRAHAILRHLLGAMVPEANPLLHERLTALYLFAMRHSTLANLKRDPAMLEEIIRVLLPLRGAWSVAAERTAREAAEARAAEADMNRLAKTG